MHWRTHLKTKLWALLMTFRHLIFDLINWVSSQIQYLSTKITRNIVTTNAVYSLSPIESRPERKPLNHHQTLPSAHLFFPGSKYQKFQTNDNQKNVNITDVQISNNVYNICNHFKQRFCSFLHLETSQLGRGLTHQSATGQM